MIYYIILSYVWVLLTKQNTKQIVIYNILMLLLTVPIMIKARTQFKKLFKHALIR